MNHTPKYMKTAFVLTFLLILLALGSMLWIVLDSEETASQDIVAYIYQDGEQINNIALDSVTETYTFTVIGENNCRNDIEVRPGSIGIISADCPDKLCVHQGFIDSSLLPITCLPNHLVIQIQTEEGSSENAPEIDVVTY